MNCTRKKTVAIKFTARMLSALALIITASVGALGSTENFSVPEDLALRIRLDDTLTSVDSEVGDPFSATIVDRGIGNAAIR